MIIKTFCLFRFYNKSGIINNINNNNNKMKVHYTIIITSLSLTIFLSFVLQLLQQTRKWNWFSVFIPIFSLQTLYLLDSIYLMIKKQPTSEDYIKRQTTTTTMSPETTSINKKETTNVPSSNINNNNNTLSLFSFFKRQRNLKLFTFIICNVLFFIFNILLCLRLENIFKTSLTLVLTPIWIIFIILLFYLFLKLIEISKEDDSKSN
jgi:hypothetical protein